MALTVTILGYNLVLTDAGRSTSKRKRQHRDCTVRAIASARGLSYDQAFDLLRAYGRRSSCRFRIQLALDAEPWAEKARVYQESVGTFTLRHPEGSWVVCVRGHAFAVIDGVVHDDHELDHTRPITQAWKISRAM